MLPGSLDGTDLRIPDILQEDGRLPNQDIADGAALSPSPCLRRIRRRQEKGGNRQYVAWFDAARLGLGSIAFVTVKREKRGTMSIEGVRARVQTWPELVACYALTGDLDYLRRVRVEGLQHSCASWWSGCSSASGLLTRDRFWPLERTGRRRRCRRDSWRRVELSRSEAISAMGDVVI